MAADRNVLVLFKPEPELSLLEQCALASRIIMNWEGTGVTYDDHIDRIALWGDPEDLSDGWIKSLNRSPHLVAIVTEEVNPKVLVYEFELEFAARDGMGQPSIKFKDNDDLALAREFCPEMRDNLMCTIVVGDGPDEDGQYTVLSIDNVLGEAYLNLNSKLLTIIPTWYGHKAHLDNGRLIEYDE